MHKRERKEVVTRQRVEENTREKLKMLKRKPFKCNVKKIILTFAFIVSGKCQSLN